MLVSYLTSHRGRPAELKRCIASVRLDMLSSGISDYEHLIFLDGDASGCEELGTSDQFNVRFFYSEINMGKGYCVNRLIDIAQGIFLFFLDSDDWNIIGRTKKQLAFLKDKNSFIAGSNFLYWDGGSVFTESEYLLDNERIKQEFWRYPLLLYSSMCVRKRDLVNNSLFFDETLIGGIDYEFYSRAFQVLSVGNNPDSLVVYRVGNEGGITASKNTRRAQLNTHKSVIQRLFDFSIADDSDLLDLMFGLVLSGDNCRNNILYQDLGRLLVERIKSGEIGQSYFPSSISRVNLEIYFKQILGLGS